MPATTVDKGIIKAVQEAQQHPVEFEDDKGVKAFLVSEELMKIIREDLKRRFEENTEKIKRQIGDKEFTDEELREIMPDYDGE